MIVSFLKIKYLLFIACLVFLSAEMSGQLRNVIGTYSPPKNEVSKKQGSNFSTKNLAYSITRNAQSDSEKVIDIYKWITHNISYDNELMRSEKLQKKIYISEENVVKKVLERKMALCGGFALLFKYLCADVGITAEAVDGFTKDYSGNLQNRKIPNHTWNVVKLNGKWELLDITWAIGHGSADKPDGFWFLTKPTDFIYTHYPEESKWTLIENPISFSEFKK